MKWLCWTIPPKPQLFAALCCKVHTDSCKLFFNAVIKCMPFITSRATCLKGRIHRHFSRTAKMNFQALLERRLFVHKPSERVRRRYQVETKENRERDPQWEGKKDRWKTIKVEDSLPERQYRNEKKKSGGKKTFETNKAKCGEVEMRVTKNTSRADRNNY